MKIYTTTGDTGTTSLYDGSRIPKHDPVLHVLGTNDLLSSHIGMLIAITPVALAPETVAPIDFLRGIQCKLQHINSLLATPDTGKATRLTQITETDVVRLEAMIDKTEAENTALREFILPGVTQLDAQAQICRAVCREVERYLCEHASTTAVSAPVLQYMNRLSDFFFVYARWLCMKRGRLECKASDIKES